VNRDLITPDEASELLGVTPATVAAYADRSLIWSTRTAGGHRRYDAADVKRLAVELKETK
jgi:excisionase family DNA binding protein